VLIYLGLTLSFLAEMGMDALAKSLYDLALIIFPSSRRLKVGFLRMGA
jgi:hypothetical protein